MNKLLFTSLLVISFLFACEEEIPGPKKEEAPTSNFVPLAPLGEGEEENISFEGPRVGQESRYVGFAATQGRDGRGFGHFQYTDDTMTVKIIDRTNFTFILEVRSTDSEVIDYYDMARLDEKVVFELRGEDPRTHLFMIPVELDLAVIETPVVNAEIEQFTNQTCSEWPCLTSITDYEQFDKTYERLNIYSDFSAMAWDRLGIYALYSADAGYVRWVRMSSVSLSRSGWDLLERE